MQGGLGNLQVIITVLGTLQLGASNYSMQCLSSPTRQEIDKAHSQGIWLDIGVPSLREMGMAVSFQNLAVAAPCYLVHTSTLTT